MVWFGIAVICVLTVLGGLKLKRRWQRQRRKLDRAAIEATMDVMPDSSAIASPIQSAQVAERQTVPSLDAQSKPPAPPPKNLEPEFQPESEPKISTPVGETPQTASGVRPSDLDRLPEPDRPNPTEPTTREIALQLADYQYLENLLADQRYEEADRVTWRLLLQLMGADERGYVELDELEFLPLAELRNLDQLWQRYSQGHWGFSAQRRLFEAASSDYSELGKRTGWMVEGTWFQKENIIYDLGRSPVGHLPQAIWRNLFKVFGAFGLSLSVDTFLMQVVFDPDSPELASHSGYETEVRETQQPIAELD